MTEKRYVDKVAIVTGGASGIGEAIVRQLFDEGACVVIADINENELDRLAIELGSKCLPIKTDVTQEGDIEKMVAAAVSEFGKLDVAFNVAGGARLGSITELTREDWEFTVDLCLNGAFLSVKHEAKQMMAARTPGAIVNIGSMSGTVPAWGHGAYSAAKAGLDMVSKTAAIELGEYGIRVNTVSPGVTETPLAISLIAPERRKVMLERIAMGRFAQTREQASASLFLNSDAASYITGHNLIVDGAWSLSAFGSMREFIMQSQQSIVKYESQLKG